MSKYRRYEFVLDVLAIVLTVVVLRYFPKPYVFMSVLWAVVCVAKSLTANRSWAKAIWVNIAVITLTFGGAEVYFYTVYFREEPPRETEYSEFEHAQAHSDIVDLLGTHDFLGWAPRKGKSFYETTRFEGEVLYHVKYTIDQHGLRTAAGFMPERKGEPECSLFFGDSFTFGEGVRDEDTLPARVGQKLNGRYQTYNFGFLGYGPHQMLAELQHGLVDAAIACKPVVAIYQALPGHVSRAAGLEAWDQIGPKFVREHDGSVMWKGPFAETTPHDMQGRFRRFHQHLSNEAKHYFLKSALYRGLLFMHRPVMDEDIDLFISIVDASKQLVETRYQSATFHVVFWDFSGDNPIEAKIIEGLKAKGIQLHLISNILPNYRGHEELFEIHRADRHPNALAYDLLADYVAKEIFHPSF